VQIRDVSLDYVGVLSLMLLLLLLLFVLRNQCFYWLPFEDMFVVDPRLLLQFLADGAEDMFVLKL
jgi:hypothetical protein